MSKASKIKQTQPRPDVDVHLPDGRVLSGPRGVMVSDFLETVSESFEAPIVAAVVNGELRELNYPINIESIIKPVTMSEADGARIYRRSLTFLLEMAYRSLHSKGKLTIDHSVSFGGYYGQVFERQALTKSEIEALKARMQELIDADIPFERQEIPIAEAIEYFRKFGLEDKIKLLSHRQKDYLTLYRLGESMDYHHGYMVPSTGYLRWFNLHETDGGFTLRFPQRHAPTELQPPATYPKLLKTFRQYGDWLVRLGISNVGALNDAIHSGRGQELILVSEALHEQHISDIARQIADRYEKLSLVLVAGPSSSGKTTFSRRLTVQLLARGISPFPLELDNYFVDRDKTPKDENGQFNFEAVEALDLHLLAEHLQQLVAGKTVHMPHYNFNTGLSEPGETIKLQQGQIIILEGIHGLNPRLIPEALSERVFRIYVSALTQLNLDRHNRVSTTDTRLIRRIVRDARERGYSAQDTISRWESVTRGEKRNIFPYQENADVMFNSALAFELAGLKQLAEPLLRQVPHGIPEHIESKRLLAFLEWFLPLDIDLIPENSIAREFLGGSNLKDFIFWKEKSH
ncbi:MAG: TGS domain-containing protein [Anaerolineae bacterium]|nr:TGS domain-containing protein [Anaerolineae bacterium]MDK1081018.1 TGS domain-containing protein [Anaerolineae bacterium]